MKPVDPRLVRYAGATRWFLAASVGLGVAGAALVIAQALLIAQIVVGAFQHGEGLSGTGRALALLAAVSVGRGLVSWLTELAAHRASASVKSTLRRRLLVRAGELGPGWAATQRSGELVALATRGVDALDDYFARYLPQLVLAVVVPVAVLARIVTADWLSAAVIAGTLPLIPLFMVLIGWATQNRMDRQWALLGRLSHHFLDVVAGLPTLKVFGRAKAQAEAVRRITDQYRRATLRTLRIAFVSSFALELLSTLSVALVAVTIGMRLVRGELDLSTGLMVLVLAPEAYLPIRQVGTHYHASVEGLSAADRIFAVLETPAPARGSAAVPMGPLVLSGLTTGHDSPVVEDFSLTVSPGEVVALTGPSGVGKSTVLDTVLGFVPATAGTVSIGDTALAEADPAAWHARIAWVPQRPYLFAGTVAENVRLAAPEASAERVRAALQAAHAWDFVAALPQGADTPVGENGQGLSAGQRQRIALARALLADRPIVLLDEPTANLDGESEAAIVAAVRALARDRAVLLTAHRPALLALATRVVPLGPTASPLHEQAPVPALPSPAPSARRPAAEPGASRLGADDEGTAVRQVAVGVARPEGEPGAAFGAPRPAAEPGPAFGAPRLGADDEGTAVRQVAVGAPRPAAEPGAAFGAPRPAGEPGAAFGAPRPGGHDEGTALPQVAVDAPRLAAAAGGELGAAFGAARLGGGGGGVLRSAQWGGRLGAGVGRVPGFGVAVGLGAGAVLCATALMGTSGWLISRASQMPPVLYLMVAVTAVRAFGIGRSALRYAERLVSHDAVLRALGALRAGVYTRLERLAPNGGGGAFRRGDLLSRMVADVDALQDRYLRVRLPRAVAVVASAVTVAVVARLLPAAGAALAAGLLLAGLAVPRLALALSLRAERAQARTRGELSEQVLGLLDGAAELTVAGALTRRQAAVEATDARLTSLQRSSAAGAGLGSGLTTALTGLTAVACGALGVAAVASGRLSGVYLAVLLLTPLAAFEAVTGLTTAAQLSRRSAESRARLQELVDAPDPVREPAEPGELPDEPLPLHVRGLSVTWPGRTDPALADLDLDLSPGRRVAVVGPSGSGKTTLAQALLRFVEPSAGRITLHGRDVTTLDGDDVRRAVGLCAQDAHVFDSSLRENLRLARPDATEQQLWDALAAARLDTWVRELPDGLDTLVGEHGDRLSGGQRRRLALARALLADFPALVLDEPAEHLDLPTADALTADLLSATEGRTTLLITHRLTGLDAVDEILVLDGGRVVQRGSWSELTCTEGPFAELWERERRMDALVSDSNPNGARSEVLTRR